jgi:membrane-associated protease RseP (regulator of RpoE activity)
MNDFEPAPEAPAHSSAVSKVRRPWRNLLLFAVTLVSVFVIGAFGSGRFGTHESMGGAYWYALTHPVHTVELGWTFAVPLMAILLTHEFGHYVAARLHGVPASLPFFIPMPLPPFGTMGAVISMPERIKSRNALLDIGAAGPLAGLCVAIPVLVIGLAQSQVKPLTGGGLMEGQCLLYFGLKRLMLGAIPDGYDVYLTQTAFAGWTGLFITMLNLLPILQLDGGHIAYALFEGRFARLSRTLHALLPIAFVYNFVTFGSFEPGIVWIVWFVLLSGLRRLGGGVEHPPTDPGTLTGKRRLVAVVCLLLFALLYMPTPLRELPERIETLYTPNLRASASATTLGT